MSTLPETNSKFAPENQWLEDEISFGARPIFRGELLVSGRVTLFIKPNENPSFCLSKEETK